METCPCGSGLDYTVCCEPLITGEKRAETAEALLRSRYSAYAKKIVDYILDTTHPEQQDPDSQKTVEKWARNTEWHQLEIVGSEAGGAGDEEGTVEFKADYTEKGRRRKHHELAKFRKKEGRWYFFDGDAPRIEQFVRSGPKVGRNDPCPCGSGKKYKKCCA
jgi:SEC-C motif-containing protein